MLFTIENNSSISSYLAKNLPPRLLPYFNQASTMGVKQFLDKKTPVSLHKFLLIDISDVSSDQYEVLAKELTEFFGTCLFYQDKSKVDFENLPKLFSNNCLGLIDLSLPASSSQIILNSIAKYIDSDADLIDADEIKDLNKYLGQMVVKVEHEMFRLKKLHHSLMPRREQVFTNLKVQSKFATGESPGGEFFDIFEDHQKMVIFLGASNSYLTSSMSSSIFAQIKGLTDFSVKSFEVVVSSVAQMLQNLQQSNKKKVLTYDLFFAVIDLKSLSMTGINFGKHVLISNKNQMVPSNEYPVEKSFINNALFELKLGRGEELALISAGIRKNSKDYLKDQNYLEFIKEKLAKSPQEFFDEVFFELRKSASSEFLAHDASLVRFQIDQKAITQV